MHSYADLVRVLRKSDDPASWRDDSRVQCKYFGSCSGCQYQTLSYERQLALKRTVVQKAYRNFSALPAALVPEIGPTLPSPRQYGYRTKLTPHFDQPSKEHRDAGGEGLAIGFQMKGRRTVLDIEECPIATEAINAHLGPARKDIRSNLSRYKRGATLLLRDSLPVDTPMEDLVEALSSTGLDDVAHVCITDHHAVVRERVADKLFTFTANSFFQNNNGILQSLVQAIRDILPPASTEPEDERFLVDAYCGSGLFALTLADRFARVSGIEISADSIRYAKINAELNGVKNVEFVAESAEAIFKVGARTGRCCEAHHAQSIMHSKRGPVQAADALKLLDGYRTSPFQKTRQQS